MLSLHPLKNIIDNSKGISEETPVCDNEGDVCTWHLGNRGLFVCGDYLVKRDKNLTEVFKSENFKKLFFQVYCESALKRVVIKRIQSVQIQRLCKVFCERWVCLCRLWWKRKDWGR